MPFCHILKAFTYTVDSSLFTTPPPPNSTLRHHPRRSAQDGVGFDLKWYSTILIYSFWLGSRATVELSNRLANCCPSSKAAGNSLRTGPTDQLLYSTPVNNFILLYISAICSQNIFFLNLKLDCLVSKFCTNSMDSAQNKRRYQWRRILT